MFTGNSKKNWNILKFFQKRNDKRKTHVTRFIVHISAIDNFCFKIRNF